VKYKTNRRFKFIQIMVISIGVFLIAVALAADWLGIGSDPEFGPSQIVLTIVGCIVLFIGLALRLQVARQLVRLSLSLKIPMVLGGLLAGLLMSEFGLRFTERKVHNQIDNGVKNEFQGLLQPIPDPRLGVRLAPYAGGHDANGFRNDTVPAQVDIVAIGDSQTWGINAKRHEAWPQMLAKLYNRTVYNMGLGYYEPVQYWVLTEEALMLSPKVIIIGLYFGNDLWDAYRLVWGSETYVSFRNKAGVDILSDTIGPRVKVLIDEESAESQFKRPTSSKLSVWLSGHSAIIRLLKRCGWLSDAAGRLKYEKAKAWALVHPDHGAVYTKGRISTVFTTAYRLLALNLNEPRIAEGLRLTKKMLILTKAKTDKSGVRLLILMIPTKELVYAEAMRELKGYLDETYTELVEMETRSRNEIVSFCDENGIKYVDTMLLLQKAIKKNEQIYPSDTDGHFMPRGYFLLASATFDELVRLGW